MQTVSNDPFVLPSELELVPIEEISEDKRAQLAYTPGDIAITRRKSRTPTKIISADLADLLQEFSTAHTVVEAMLLHSAKRSLDPMTLLEDAFPFLQELIGDQLLVPAANDDPDAVPRLERGDRIGEYTVVRKLHDLLDTGLYQVRDEAGTVRALKLAKSGGSPAIALAVEHEAQVLQHLHIPVTPGYIDHGLYEEQPYLVMEWRAGINVGAAAAELRRGGSPEKRGKLLRLCTAVLAAYAKLHENNAIHGDIHPGNILVDADEQISLVDFGLARIDTGASALSEPYRGGVAFFSDPQFCRASLQRQSPPPLSKTAEQYALAALLYHLLTGVQYLDFSLEEEVLWKQIVEDAPLSFADHGDAPWPEVEAVLGKALSKLPADRFESVAEFFAALQSVTDQEELKFKVASETGSGVSEQFAAGVLDYVGLQGELLKNDVLPAPSASLNYGAAGIAYFLYRAACTRSDPRLLALADVWISKAEFMAVDESGFINTDLDISHDTVGRISPFHSVTGLYIVRALLAQAMGDDRQQIAFVEQYVKAAALDTDELDLALGKSGILLHAALIYDSLGDKTWADQTGLMRLGNQTMDLIWRRIDKFGTIDQLCPATNLGIAHGWAGYLYATLKWCLSSGSPLPDSFVTRLRELAAFAEPTGRGVQWPWDLSNIVPDYMPGWCNGSAGYVFLWSDVYQAFNDDAYLELALRSGWNAWESAPSPANLCCGLAGRAYALLRLYKLSGDDIWLDRARRLGKQAADSARDQGDEFVGFEHSLYKADVGIAALLVDLEQPQQAAMPFFESFERA